MPKKSRWRSLVVFTWPVALAGACNQGEAPQTQPQGGGATDAGADGAAAMSVRDAGPRAERPVYVPPAPPPAVLAPWASADIGTVALKGSSGATIDRLFVNGAGFDIGGAQDAFQFTHQKATGNVAVIGKLRAMDFVDADTKAGLMIRASLDPGAPNVFVGTTGKVVGIVQTRAMAGGPTKTEVVDKEIKTGTWLRIARAGGNVTVDRSTDKVMWTRVGAFPIALPSEVHVGMAVSSHNPMVVARAEFDGMRATNLGVEEATKAWWLEDIGIIGGYAVLEGGTMKIGAPGDKWTNVREFMNLAFQEVSGDATITARVAKLDGADPLARVSIGFRVGSVSGGSGRGAQHALASVTTMSGADFRLRARTDADVTAGMPSAALKAPLWLRVQRTGETFRAFFSADGKADWTLLGEGTIPMIAAKLAVGVGVSSNALTAFAHAEVDNVSVVAASPPPGSADGGTDR